MVVFVVVGLGKISSRTGTTRPRYAAQHTGAHRSLLDQPILETEHTIKLLDPKFQDANRLMATEKLKQIHNANHNSNVTHKRYTHIAKKNPPQDFRFMVPCITYQYYECTSDNHLPTCHVGRCLSDVHSYQGLHLQLYTPDEGCKKRPKHVEW